MLSQCILKKQNHLECLGTKVSFSLQGWRRIVARIVIAGILSSLRSTATLGDLWICNNLASRNAVELLNEILVVLSQVLWLQFHATLGPFLLFRVPINGLTVGIILGLSALFHGLFLSSLVHTTLLVLSLSPMLLVDVVVSCEIVRLSTIAELSILNCADFALFFGVVRLGTFAGLTFLDTLVVIIISFIIIAVVAFIRLPNVELRLSFSFIRLGQILFSLGTRGLGISLSVIISVHNAHVFSSLNFKLVVILNDLILTSTLFHIVCGGTLCVMSHISITSTHSLTSSSRILKVLSLISLITHNLFFRNCFHWLMTHNFLISAHSLKLGNCMFSSLILTSLKIALHWFSGLCILRKLILTLIIALHRCSGLCILRKMSLTLIIARCLSFGCSMLRMLSHTVILVPCLSSGWIMLRLLSLPLIIDHSHSSWCPMFRLLILIVIIAHSLSSWCPMLRLLKLTVNITQSLYSRYSMPKMLSLIYFCHLDFRIIEVDVSFDCLCLIENGILEL